MALKRRSVKVLGVTAAAVVALAPVVLTTAPVAQAQQGPSVLRVAITQDIDSMNPFLAKFASSTEMGRLMYEFLTTYSAKDMSVTGGLAEKWEPAADKLTWTFTLRSGAKWSDGKPITAKDVAYTYNLMMTNEVAATANGSYVASFESVKATDDKTLVIKTKTPQATILALDMPVVPEHVFSGVTDLAKYANDKGPVVGSGPFILTEFSPKQHIKFKANKDYWRGAPKIDELQFLYYNTSDSAVQALRKGEVDLVNRLTPPQFDALKDDKNIKQNSAAWKRFYEVIINPGAATKDGKPIGNGNPALKDVKVRRAIAQSMDKKALVDKVLNGYGTVGGGFVPPALGDYHWAPSADKELKYDPAAANKALDEAGYPKGGDGIRVGKDGKPLNLKLIGRNDRGADTTSGEYVKRWLAEIGIAVDFQPVAGNRLDELTTEGSFDLAFSGWGTSPDPDYNLSLQTCGNRPNADGKGGTPDSFLCDPEYDAMYAKQLAELDHGKRAEIVRKMQERFYELSPSVVLFYENALEAYRSDRFSAFKTQPDPGGIIREQSGYWGYYGAEPVAKKDEGAGGGSNTVVTVVLVAGGVAVVALVVVLFSRRRRTSADDRE